METQKDFEYRMNGVENQVERLKKYTDKYKIPISSIVECGARDCLTTNIIAEKYKDAQIYAFECLPENIELCKKNINNKNVHLIEHALSDKESILDFFITEEGGPLLSTSMLEETRVL